MLVSSASSRSFPGLERRGLELLETIRVLVRNEAGQVALTQHEGPCCPLWPSPLPSLSHPNVRGFFMGGAETVRSVIGYNREGCHTSGLLHGPGGLLTHWQ